MAEAVHILILGEVTKFLNLSEFPKYCSDFPQVAKYSRTQYENRYRRENLGLNQISSDQYRV